MRTHAASAARCPALPTQNMLSETPTSSPPSSSATAAAAGSPRLSPTLTGGAGAGAGDGRLGHLCAIGTSPKLS